MSDETEDERARRLLTRQEQVNLPKRFYKQVSVAPAEGGFEVQLDGRSVKTPLKRALVMPGEPMAQAVADEWDAQETHIDPTAMIITRLANTAIDRVAGDEARIVNEIVQFSASDMVCYRADTPDSLVGRQGAQWDPVLDWAHQTLGCRFMNNGELVFGIPQVGMLDLDDGSYLENAELQPDYLVPLTAEDAAAGRDPQLEKAVEVLLDTVSGR